MQKFRGRKKLNLTRDKVVIDFRERPREKAGNLSGQYPHVVNDYLYWQLASPSEICYAKKEESGYVKPTDNIIIKNSLASQNFRVFYDTNPNCKPDERYKAVGGYHVGKTHEVVKNCEVSKKATQIWVQDHVWPDTTKGLFEDNYSHPRHANGIYVFKSSDGLDWELHHDLPILSEFTSMDPDPIVGCDTMPSIFYDDNIGEYVLYIRCNIRLGVRHVLYTKSKDLVNWDKPILINKEPSFDMDHENLYYLCASRYPNSNKYIAFPPHFKNDILTPNGSNRRYYETKTLVMVSDDGINWKVVDKILDKEYNQHMRQPHVVSFREEGDEYALYVHEGYWTQSGKLVRYIVDKNELDNLV